MPTIIAQPAVRYGFPAVLANGKSAIATPPATGSAVPLGPGVTMPAGSGGWQPPPIVGSGSRPVQSWQGRHGGQGGGYSQAQQLAINEASGQPLEVSAGVWVYPNGQPVTGEQLAALNSASTVLPAASDAEGNTILAEEQAAQAAAAPATATATTTTGTSWLDENTITSSYTNGQVVLAGGLVLALVYLFKRR
jgi:choline dehydrogenase-like flavoprotein